MYTNCKTVFAKTSAMITGMGATSITKNFIVKNMIIFIGCHFLSVIIYFVNSDNEKFLN